MRGLIGIVGLVAVTVAACDRPMPVALNGPPPMLYPPAPAQYPPPVAAQYQPPAPPVVNTPTPTIAGAPPPDVARAAMIADDTGQWAGTIRVDTLELNSSTKKGSATVCHQSERGPSCNTWTFDCDKNSLLDGVPAHSDYSLQFIQRTNIQSLTPAQNAELLALGAVASKLPAAACRLRGVNTSVDTPRWIEVREGTGEVKATIDVSSIKLDADGNAHARVCLNYEPGVTCPASKTILRWFFNCRSHEYSAIDTTVLPGFPHEMTAAQPNSVAAKLAILACGS